jgi:hypothetical protein
MYIPTLGHTWRLTRVVARRLVYFKKKRVNQTLATRFVPYVVEFINDHRITAEHIATVINVLAETEILTACIRAVGIAMSLRKYVGK